MTQPFPQEIRDRAHHAGGPQGVKVLAVLAGQGPTTDTVIADTLETNTSTVRRRLYQLFEARLADYEERRDAEQGWLVYEWRYTPKHARRALEAEREEAAEQIRQQIQEAEGQDWFVCPSDHARASFEDAMGYEFHCPHCDAVLEREDASKRIQALREELTALETGTAKA